MQSTLNANIKSLQHYEAEIPQLEAYLNDFWLTNLANFSSFVFHSLPDLNWAGFYLYDGEKLKLGPFVGRPACMEIRPGRGVCGAAFSERKPMLVADVDSFPGHIVCDQRSRSELVLPFLVKGECLGVFDLDSPSLDRFRDYDREGLTLWLDSLGARMPKKMEMP